MSEPRYEFTAEEARRAGEEIGIDWASAAFDVDQFRIGMNVELEHGLPETAEARLRPIPSSCAAFVPPTSRPCPHFPACRSMVRRGSAVRVRRHGVGVG
jgi:hypothetical protein